MGYRRSTIGLTLKTDQEKQSKILTFSELESLLEEHRKKGRKIIQCHGVFDLLHPGHIRHFREAKSLGDKLVVTITPDHFVNKGPGRPAFPEGYRLESLAALEDIDYVVLNDSPDAVSAIQKLRPNVYVKGGEYINHENDVTGKISTETLAVHSVGGTIHYTNDDVIFSSSTLLNRYFDPPSPDLSNFLSQFKSQYCLDEALRKIEELSNLKVLVIGDAIVDEYQYVEPMGLSGKGLHMVGKCLDNERFLGGSLIIANHLAEFAGEVTLITALGMKCPHLSFIKSNLDPKIWTKYTFLEDTTTLTKKRYVLKDGSAITKLFETYSGQEKTLTPRQTDDICTLLRNSNYDLVLACDFGNGFTNPQLINAITDVPTFLALNTQTNSGNRGFNVLTNYRRADYISLNEGELRLSMQDRTSPLEEIVSEAFEIMNCQVVSITKGVRGVDCFDINGKSIFIPALSTRSVDRIGAGDSYLSLSSLCFAKGYPPIFSGLIGAIAASMSVQVVGNQDSIKKSSLCKYLTRLLK